MYVDFKKKHTDSPPVSQITYFVVAIKEILRFNILSMNNENI